MTEVMFWNEANEALRIGDESKFYFESDSDAMKFIGSVNLPDAVEVTIDGVIYPVYEEADDYSQNAPCDNSGICVGSNCPYFWQCNNN